MSLFEGRKIKVEIYGESHAEKIGVKVSGFPSFEFDPEALAKFTDRRKPSGDVFSTKRKEADVPVFTGITHNRIGGAFSAEIYNTDRKSSDYGELYGKPRPSHADYARYLKDGALDFTGGGRFSGRMTAPLCVAGGIALQYLEKINIKIAAYVSSIGSVCGRSYKDGEISAAEAEALRAGEFPSLDKKKEMLEEIRRAAADCDSVGGRAECIVSGLKGGVGDNLFGGLEGKIAYLIYAVPAVKGVEFGYGFSLSSMRGSEANDGLYIKNGKVGFLSNRSGGINGGISNGGNITVSIAFRPTPSIYQEQQTVDLVKKETVKIKIKGRHDSCIVPRALPCVESAVALALLDEII